MTSKTILRGIYGAYVIAILALLASPRAWLPAFYTPSYMAGISVAGMAAVFLPGYWARNSSPQRQAMASQYQAAFAISVALNGLGGLGLYKLYEYGIQYDKILHFIVSGVLVLVCAHWLHFWRGWKAWSAILAAVMALVLGGIIWEAWEVFADFIFHTHTAGIYGTDYLSDTLSDLACDVGGAGLAGIFLWLDYTKRFIMNKIPFSLRAKIS